MPKSPPTTTFGSVLTQIRTSLGLTRDRIAEACGVGPRTVTRWEKNENSPSLADRHRLLHILVEAPVAQLEQLAQLAGITLESAGIAVPPAVPPAPARAPVTAPLPASVDRAGAQRAVDEAIRTAAEELDVTARALRPVASRLFRTLGAAGFSMEDAAELVLNGSVVRDA